MLPRAARLTSGADFRSTIRGGVRAGRSCVVVHARHTGGMEVRVGFVVSRAVGGAVVRNRVRRRLRHLAAAEIPATPAGTDLVVRALPPAANTPAALPGDVRSAWHQVLGRMRGPADGAEPGGVA